MFNNVSFLRPLKQISTNRSLRFLTQIGNQSKFESASDLLQNIDRKISNLEQRIITTVEEMKMNCSASSAVDSVLPKKLYRSEALEKIDLISSEISLFYDVLNIVIHLDCNSANIEIASNAIQEIYRLLNRINNDTILAYSLKHSYNDIKESDYSSITFFNKSIFGLEKNNFAENMSRKELIGEKVMILKKIENAYHENIQSHFAARICNQIVNYSFNELKQDQALIHNENIRNSLYNAISNIKYNRNIDNFLNILNTRLEISKLNGYDCYIDMVMDNDHLLDNKEKLKNFILKEIKLVGNEIEKRKFNDYLQEFKKKESNNIVSQNLKIWDYDFTVLNLRKKDSKNHPMNISLDLTIRSLNEIVNRCFGLTIDFEKSYSHDFLRDCQIYKCDILNPCKINIGSIYINLNSMPNKIMPSCHFTLNSGKLDKSNRNLIDIPEVVLSINVANQKKLSSYERRDLFHEFGHAIHSILGCNKFQQLSGAKSSMDFVEIPSELFEIFYSQIIYKDSQEYEIVENIRDLSYEIQACNAIERVNSLLYGLIDLEIHSKTEPITIEIIDEMRQIFNEYSLFKEMPDHSQFLNFPHFTLYPSQYSSYSLSKKIAESIFTNIYKNNIFSSDANVKLAKLLRQGAAKLPTQIIDESFGPQLLENIFI